tara:strand:+ start:282 stop:854 length:573 start_codon:yes stop_codon:yes gene_type:complete
LKVSKARSEANRQAVVEAAGRSFREHGVRGVAVADLMQAVGLTHGGFYKKFGSRDDLVREAMARALTTSRQRLTNRVARATSDPFAVLVASYLSRGHRQNLAEGCAFAALSPEVSRSDDEALKEIFSDELERYLELVEGVMTAEPDQETRNRAIAAFSAMVGGLILSRVAQDPALAETILTATADELLKG